MFSEIIKIARKDPLAKSVRLYVDADNERAIGVYERLGMTRLTECNFDELDFHFPEWLKINSWI